MNYQLLVIRQYQFTILTITFLSIINPYISGEVRDGIPFYAYILDNSPVLNQICRFGRTDCSFNLQKQKTKSVCKFAQLRRMANKTIHTMAVLPQPAYDQNLELKGQNNTIIIEWQK